MVIGLMKPHSRALSLIDAFFVAYQERTGTLMQFGAEAEVAGELSREALEQTMAFVTSRWPQLGQTLQRRLTGLAWSGDCQVAKMVQIVSRPDRTVIDGWRNRPIDPFHEPPFQLLAVLTQVRTTLAFRAHHSVADGASMFVVCGEALRALATILAGQSASSLLSRVEASAGNRPTTKLRLNKVRGMWSYWRELAALGRPGRNARLSVRAHTPGDIGTVERSLRMEDLRILSRRACDVSVGTPWLFASSWIRGIGTWNVSRNSTSSPVISIEVPVNMRVGRKGRDYVGNLISPLTLFADSTQPLEEIARDLLRQFKEGLRRRHHTVVPLVTSPARYLPWPMFRKLAVNSTSTGFATSHFTWLERKGDIYGEVSTLSGGALRILEHHAYGPVCLHMGAALMVIVLHDSIKICLTYRRTAFEEVEAQMLCDLFFAELTGQPTHVVSLGR